MGCGCSCRPSASRPRERPWCVSLASRAPAATSPDSPPSWRRTVWFSRSTLRGRGRSDYDPTALSYRLETYVSDVLRVLDHFALASSALIGTSLGGLTAMWLGAARPDRVEAVVLNDIGPEIQPEGAARIAAYAGRLPPVRTWDDAVRQTRLVSEAAAPDLTDDEWLVVARQRYRQGPDGTVVIDHDPGVATGPMPAEDPWLVFEQLAGIPILVLRGSTSDVLASSTVQAMRARRPDIVSIEIPDRGHAPTLDEPVARVSIRRFLESATTRRAR
jgi:pimeloyl-ACP methyl ester carboxylesterase